MDAFGKRLEIAYALDFVVGQLDAEMILDSREQIERLQTVDGQLLVEIVVGLQRSPQRP